MQQHQHICLILAGLTLLISSLFLHPRAQPDTGDEGSCYGSASSPCTSARSNITFPFVRTRSCGRNSKLFIAGCSYPNIASWPGFEEATPGASSAPLVRGLAAQSGHDFINLTWNMNLVNQHHNDAQPIPLTNLSQYLPPTVNLTFFLDSFFTFSSFNIFLLFGCNETLASGNESLKKTSPACESYAKVQNCFQYRPHHDKELTMQQDAYGAHCNSFLFFISTSSMENFTDVSQWRPGLIQLTWSITMPGSNTRLASYYAKCKVCLESNGTCGYTDTDQFQCFCSENRSSATVCGVTNSKQSFRRVLIIALALGIPGTMAIVVAALFSFWGRRKANAVNNDPRKDRLWNKKPSFLTRKQDPIEEFTYQELKEATDSFADTRMLGDGGFGVVYMGSLADHRKVAVKKLYHDNLRSMEHFTNEIKILSKLNHPNLVKLYGFCWESERNVLLVFEYAPNGTVFDHLHNPSKCAMPWKLRLNIAYETANALCYLHNCVSPPIYHRDVKTTNILLDEGYHAKLGDFGLSKLVPPHVTHISTAPQGTPGYLDPEYNECYQLTDKSDVYSMGVVLMELVSGKLAVDLSRGKGEINLCTLAVVKIKCGLWEELVDPKLKMKKSSATEKMVKGVIELAFECLQAERDNRPVISTVAESLDRLQRNFAHVDEDGDDDP